MVICDVSLSVRNTARFMLHLVYNLQSLFGQVRSFAFVSDLVEVSACFLSNRALMRRLALYSTAV